MPPKTGSQTARSHLTNPPTSLPTLEEDLRNLDVGGVQPPPPESDPAAERREAEGIENRTTPRSRKITRTVASSQRNGTRDADPNEGRCLITNRPIPVQLCHLVARATDRETLTKLEHVWEIGHRRFHLDTKRNMLHLRADWHILFDDSRWILVPEVKIIEELKKIYLTDERPTSNLAKQFENRSFHYYVVPAPSLQELICRFPNVNSHEHDTYAPPFSELGSLSSHVHPHYVIFNTGQKLSNKFNRGEVARMRQFLSRNLSTTFEDVSPLDNIEDLYNKWMKTQVPTQWRNHHTSSNPPRPPGEEGQDDASQGNPPPRRQGLRSATRSQGQGSRASAGQYNGGQQRAILPFQPPEDDDSSSVTDDTVVEDDVAWIEYIHNWQKRGEGAAERRRSDVLNNSCDKQLAAYIDEHARTPPSPGVWDSWEPAWDDRKSQYPGESDRSQFSSNDWAVFKNDVYLTRPEHPQVTS